MIRLALIAAALAACTTDAPTPTCESLGAPSTLLCNKAGTCEFDGQACTVQPPAPPTPLERCGYAPEYTDPAPAFTTIGTDHESVAVLLVDDWTKLDGWTQQMRTWRDCIEGAW